MNTNILIVEDDETTRMMMEGTLQTSGFDIESAADAESALEKLQSKKFHLLYLDINLPGMSGLELCRKIRQELKDNEIYIVAATANDRPEDLLEILQTGANDYMAKPLHPKVLGIRTRVAGFTLEKIAERREFETKLAESEERHRIISENGRDVVITWNNSGKITYVNQAIENVLGYNMKGFIGTNLREFIHPEDVEQALPQGKHEILNGRLEEITEFRMRTGAEEYAWMEAFHRPIQATNGDEIQEWITYIRESQSNLNEERRTTTLEELLDNDNLELEKILERIAKAFSGKVLIIEENKTGKPPYKLIFETGQHRENISKAIELLWQGERQEETVSHTGQSRKQPYLIQKSLPLLTGEESSQTLFPWQSGMIWSIPQPEDSEKALKKIIILSETPIQEKGYTSTRTCLKLAATILAIKLHKQSA